jgi:hypothetical protein
MRLLDDQGLKTTNQRKREIDATCALHDLGLPVSQAELTEAQAAADELLQRYDGELELRRANWTILNANLCGKLMKMRKQGQMDWVWRMPWCSVRLTIPPSTRIPITLFCRKRCSSLGLISLTLSYPKRTIDHDRARG